MFIYWNPLLESLTLENNSYKSLGKIPLDSENGSSISYVECPRIE